MKISSRSGHLLVITTLTAMVLCILPATNGQRLSQGASDWYMRFRGFDMMKRHVDEPFTKMFHVTSLVAHRYAITEVETKIHNPATHKQVFRFGIIMSKTAFISNVILKRICGMESSCMEDVVYSHIDASVLLPTSAQPTQDAHANGDSQEQEFFATSGKQSQHEKDILNSEKEDDHTDFKQFILPIYMKPNDTVILNLVYEDLLIRQMDRYVHSLSICPGEIVPDFQVTLVIAESKMLKNVSVVAPVIGDITDKEDWKWSSVSSHLHDITETIQQVAGTPFVQGFVFNISTIQQSEYFGKHGFIGSFRLEYDPYGLGCKEQEQPFCSLLHSAPRTQDNSQASHHCPRCFGIYAWAKV